MRCCAACSFNTHPHVKRFKVACTALVMGPRHHPGHMISMDKPVQGSLPCVHCAGTGGETTHHVGISKERAQEHNHHHHHNNKQHQLRLGRHTTPALWLQDCTQFLPH